jgi:hypothetical protein
VRFGVLISNIVAILFGIGGLTFGMGSLTRIAMSSGMSSRASSSALSGGMVGDLMLSLAIISLVALFIFTVISEYLLGCAFDEDKSLGILMAIPACGTITSAFVVFDAEIEYGGPMGDPDSYIEVADDDDEDDEE